MSTVLWVILAFAVGGAGGVLVGGLIAMAKVSRLEDENWRLRRDLIRFQNQRLDI